MSPQATSYNPETQVYTCKTKLAAIVERFGISAAVLDSAVNAEVSYEIAEQQMRVAA